MADFLISIDYKPSFNRYKQRQTAVVEKNMYLNQNNIITKYLYLYVLIIALMVNFTSSAQRGKKATSRKQTPVKVMTKEDSLAVNYVADTAINKMGRRPAYRLRDRQTNRYVQTPTRSPLVLKDPKVIKNDYRLDPETKEVGVYEKIGKYTYRTPQDLSFNQYSSIQNRVVRQNLLREFALSSDGQSAVAGRGLKPLISKSPLADKIFGGSGEALFKPNGFVTIDMGIRNEFTNNPAVALALRSITNFNFDQHINLNFNGKVGEKLGLLTNFDTKSTFNFENQLRLNYKSDPENILQKFDAGNVTMQLNSQLIPGVQNLFGVKSTLRFGKTDVQILAAQQRSKTETIILRSGQQNKGFEVRCDNYDENRHFFLSQFFRDNYEQSLKNLPAVTSLVRITRVEVYVTNRTNSYETQRNIVGFADLGESKPYSPTIKGTGLKGADNNGSNDLYKKLSTDITFRKVDQTNNRLTDLGLKRTEDYELLRGAKRLNERDFRFNPDLGYISLLSQLRNDEVIAVAYEYTYNGRVYKVGELTEDYSIRPEEEVIALKLLKTSTMRNRTDLPMWNLMMKNVYSLPTAGVTKQGFQLRLIYKDDQTGFDTPTLQEGRKLKDEPLVQVLGLDRLNSQGDGQPDGNFDYVEGITVDSKNGKIIFPILEPFGKYLGKFFEADESILKDKYVFNQLYTGTMTDAQQVTTKNKFFLRGNYQSGGVNDVQLPIGVDPKSVRVMAGGNSLSEGTDFIVDGQSGKLRITNPGVMNSAREVRIEYEKPEIFMNQNRSLYGARIDHNFSKDFHFGFTGMAMRESPPSFTTRVPIGQEPVNNAIIGADVTLKKDARWLTRLLDALPLIQTKEMSLIQIQAEYARLFPGVSPKIKTFADNSVMIDEFEAARNIYDLARQPNRWRLGSTPIDIIERSGTKTGTYESAYKRAKLSAYRIDDSFYGFGAGVSFQNPAAGQGIDNLYERPFQVQDVFVNRSNTQFANQAPLINIDFAYYPSERGMYNYNPDLDANGRLKNPRQNFGSVMRAVSADNDFDNSNIEIIEFWALNPFNDVVRDGFENVKNTTGGKLKFQLGDISEDVIPDEYNNFENGLPSDLPIIDRNYRKTNWGRAPKVQFLIDAFANTTGAREKQDVGLEGLADKDEATEPHIADFLSKVKAIPGIKNDALNGILKDPSADNFRFYLDASFENLPTGTPPVSYLKRYKDYLGMEGNSPIDEQTNANTNPNQASLINSTQAATAQPDKEDLNIDNTISDVEAFYEYELDIKPGKLAVGTNNIVDRIEKNGGEWFLFRVPIRGFTRKVGNINGFKSIRFIRTVVTDWQQPVVMRLASFQLVGNSYRVYDKDLDTRGLTEIPEPYDAQFKVGVVNIEENGCDDGGTDGTTSNCNVKPGKTPYKIPPGFIRDRDVNSQFPVFFNEQSMTLSVTNLRDNDSRAAFKNGNFMLTNYERLKMFIHMENPDNESGKVSAFLRLGTDVSENYYEIEVPELLATTNGSSNVNAIWPRQNGIDVPIAELLQTKSERNRQTDRTLSKPYSRIYKGDSSTYKLTVVGNPDLSAVLTLMIGVRNPKSSDELPKSFTIWVNELRVSGFNQEQGQAAIGTASVRLADIGNVVMNGNWRTFGYGGVQEKVNQRARENTLEFGVTANLELDKFFPEKWGLKIPLYVTSDQSVIKPHFNPLDPDMPLEQSLNDIFDPNDAERNKGLSSEQIAESRAKRDRYRKLVEERMTRKGFNFSNVRKIRVGENPKNHFYDIENLSATYAQSTQQRSSILIDEFASNTYKGGLSYNYTFSPKSFEPFAKVKGLDKPRYQWLKDFNISPMPSVVAFRTDFDRMFTKTLYRNSDLTTAGVQPNFEKYFLMNRFYDAQWNLTKSLLVNYSGIMNAIVDEPFGDKSIVSNSSQQERRDSLLGNLRKLGRAKLFDQKLSATYQIPLEKLYILDWIQAQAVANTTFKYQAASFGIKDTLNVPFGNVIYNGRDAGVQGRIDLVKLYNKIRYLKFANSPSPPKKNFARSPGDDEEIEKPKSETLKNFTRLLMAIRGIQFNAGIQETTILPGFMPSPQLLGTTIGRANAVSAPGLGFSLFGQQDREFQMKAANNGWLSKSTSQPLPFVQTRVKRFEFSTNIEPVKDLRIQIKGNINRGDNYQEFYRYDDVTKSYQTSTPVRSGQFSMSFWSFRTSFAQFQGAFQNKQVRKDSLGSPLFDNLLRYRQIMIDRLSKNKKEAGTYNQNSQDVLIPAFFAAYTGRKPETVTLNPFLKFPMPNWRVDYGKLADLKPFKKRFSSITLTHAYSSTYSVGNFTSSLDYASKFVNLAVNNYPTSFISNAEMQFIPVFVMSSITMQEKFAPFASIQFTTKKNISGRLEYNQERNVALNLSNATVAELSNRDFVFGFGYKKNKMKLPFRINGETITLKNDVVVRFDWTIRDSGLLLRKLEDGSSTITQGSFNNLLRYSVQYQFNKRVQGNFYIDYAKNDPKNTTSFLRRQTSGGIQLRFSLAD